MAPPPRDRPARASGEPPDGTRTRPVRTAACGATYRRLDAIPGAWTLRSDGGAVVNALRRQEFAAFYSQAHSGFTPFPWQERLLDRVLEHGWPELIDVPTGLGKTSILDVAVFAAALGSENARRRIFFVVDRKLIVDEAYRHACEIQDALAHASPESVAGRVSMALLVDGDDRALDVT